MDAATCKAGCLLTLIHIPTVANYQAQNSFGFSMHKINLQYFKKLLDLKCLPTDLAKISTDNYSPANNWWSKK